MYSSIHGYIHAHTHTCIHTCMCAYSVTDTYICITVTRKCAVTERGHIRMYICVRTHLVTCMCMCMTMYTQALNYAAKMERCDAGMWEFILQCPDFHVQFYEFPADYFNFNNTYSPASTPDIAGLKRFATVRRTTALNESYDPHPALVRLNSEMGRQDFCNLITVLMEQSDFSTSSILTTSYAAMQRVYCLEQVRVKDLHITKYEEVSGETAEETTSTCPEEGSTFHASTNASDSWCVQYLSMAITGGKGNYGQSASKFCLCYHPIILPSIVLSYRELTYSHARTYTHMKCARRRHKVCWSDSPQVCSDCVVCLHSCMSYCIILCCNMHSRSVSVFLSLPLTSNQHIHRCLMMVQLTLCHCDCLYHRHLWACGISHLAWMFLDTYVTHNDGTNYLPRVVVDWNDSSTWCNLKVFRSDVHNHSSTCTEVTTKMSAAMMQMQGWDEFRVRHSDKKGYSRRAGASYHEIQGGKGAEGDRMGGWTNSSSANAAATTSNLREKSYMNDKVPLQGMISCSGHNRKQEPDHLNNVVGSTGTPLFLF
jgi:hypothetical protein